MSNHDKSCWALHFCKFLYEATVVFAVLTLSWGGWGKFTPPYLLLPINPGKIAFNAGYDLTFSFYLFYTLCEVFMTIGAVLRKIRGVFT